MKQYVFVAGVDYEFKGVTFKVLADNRMNRFISANAAAKDELRFYILDFKTGKEELTTITYPEGSKTTSKTTLKTFEAITSSHYGTVLDSAGNPHTAFKDNQRAVMSISYVYERVQVLGATEPGTLHEFSFFSHGWMGGPILVNSFDNRSQEVSVSGAGGAAPVTTIMSVSGTFRDPDDMDPRVNYDFVPPNMDAPTLAALQAAFHADGVAWIWGCAFPALIHSLLTKVEKSSGYRSTTLADTTVLTLRNLSTEERDLIATFSRSLVVPPDTGDVDIRFDVVKYIMCVANVGSFAFALARATNTTTYAAPIGTYSEFDQTGSRPLMNVSSKFTAHFNFYTNHLGYTFDPEGRRFAAYKPDMTCTRPVP